jgi:tetratricopeptide (TPR) repeat protein
LQSGRVQEVQGSIQVFSMILQLFPNTALTYKNLSQAYVKLGDTQKAITLLNKTISLDADGDIGKAAKEMLMAIKN